jgi:F-type H+-transporting ATPase subunit alpha
MTQPGNTPKSFDRIREAMDQELRSLLERNTPLIERVVEDQTNSGRVIEFADGVARLTGMTNVHIGEPVTFRDSSVRARRHDGMEPEIYGMVVDLDEDEVGCLVFGEERFVREGDTVMRGIQRLEGVQPVQGAQEDVGSWNADATAPHQFSIPVGPHLLGTVVDPFCRDLQNATHMLATTVETEVPVQLPVDRRTVGVLHRRTIHEPLITGLTAVDATLPIGRGQRMLIIGDRNTGKTSIGVDAIITINDENRERNLTNSDFRNHDPETVYCVYVAIGRKASEIRRMEQMLRDRNAMEYTTIVAATANDPAPLVYIAPFAGTSIAEYFRDIGRNALIIYDDLSRHAAAYRHISLILRRSPGREAYPGDVFYLHARLLERACKMAGATPDETAAQLDNLRNNHGYVSDDLRELYAPYMAKRRMEIRGGGSLTALPIIETKQSDYAAYIPTNVISITDGQIYLEPDLFNEGLRPAINHGISVSRVGGAAQPPLMRLFSNRLRINLASYRNQMRYANFGVETADTEFLRPWGNTIETLLTQETGKPRSIEWETAAIFLGVNGFLAACDNAREIAALVDTFCEQFRSSLAAGNDGEKLPAPSEVNAWIDAFTNTGFNQFRELLLQKSRVWKDDAPRQGSKWRRLYEACGGADATPTQTTLDNLIAQWKVEIDGEIKSLGNGGLQSDEIWYTKLDRGYLQRWQRLRAKYC